MSSETTTFMENHIYENVQIGEGAIIEPGVILGLPPHGKKDGELKTVIGQNSYIRAGTIIYAGTEIGEEFQTGPHVLIREENTIGNRVSIWANTVLNPKNEIFENCRIHAGCFLEDVTLGSEVFIAPNVTFTNDPHPTNPPTRTHMRGAIVGKHAIIGAGVTILPHITIGSHALVGAGSVVTKDIPDHKVVYGNPARVIKNVQEVFCKKDGGHHPYKK